MVIILNASDPDENISTYELIKNKGYPVEEHNVTTQDGYILTMHRINKPDSSSSSSLKQVVLLQHGLMDSSSTWVVNFANQSLGFILADNNYDVWLGNHRGNRYSQSHIKYNTTQEEYWNFSLFNNLIFHLIKCIIFLDEFASYDIPAMINYVTRQTNQSKIYYIGHSQGAMVLLARLSRNNDDLAEKIKIFIAMGPVAYLGNVIGPIKKVAEIGVHYWYKLFGRKVFLPSNTLTELIADKICGQIGRKLCMEMVNLISGPTINLNVSRLSVYLSHC